MIDPGLQPERTLLAWRRTSLSLAVGVAFAARYALEASVVVALLVAAGGLATISGAYVLAKRRYHRVRASFDVPEQGLVAGGRSVAALAITGISLCVAAGAFVIERSIG